MAKVSHSTSPIAFPAKPSSPTPNFLAHSENEVEATLRGAQASAHALRMRITMSTVLVGTIPMVAGNAVYYLTEFFVLSPSAVGQTGWWGSLICLSGFLMLLGVMPNDARIIRALCLVASVSLIFVGVVAMTLGLYGYFGTNPSSMCEDKSSLGCNIFLAKWCVLFTIFVCGGVAASKLLLRKPNATGYKEDAFAAPARAALTRLWLTARCTIAIAGACYIVSAALFQLGGAPLYSTSNLVADAFMGATWVMTPILFTPGRRRNMHAWLGKLNTSGETASAAAVAALIGGMDPARSLSLAKSKFRTISFGKLSESDWRANSQHADRTNALFSSTDATELGGCDGFVSHSWSDNGPAKFKALGRWAAAHERATGRQPQLWLDKACIDQENIDESLQCLPVFLAGCKKLIIVAGSSYVGRLWCIMEVFVFLKMGGSTDRITILPIGMSEEEARRRFSELDVEGCGCFKESDKQKLFAIIEQGFGNFASFNQAVRRVFSERLQSLPSAVLSSCREG